MPHGSKECRNCERLRSRLRKVASLVNSWLANPQISAVLSDTAGSDFEKFGSFAEDLAALLCAGEHGDKHSAFDHVTNPRPGPPPLWINNAGHLAALAALG